MLCVLKAKSQQEGPEPSLVFEEPPTPSLYVYESVELELSLTTVSIETDEPVVDDFSCPIRLLSG